MSIERDVMIKIRSVRKSFGSHVVLNDVTLDVSRQQVCVILGPSGSGKSTLLRCMAALEEYESGEILIDGECIGYREQAGRRVRLGDAALSRQRAEIGMVFQSFNLFPHLRVLDNITLGLIKVRKESRRAAEEQARAWLDRVGLGDKSGVYPGQLSGGQQQRVAIARAVAMRPKVLLLDEVTSALDPELVGEVLDVIRRLAAEGITMLVVTHEMLFARDVAQHLVFMDDGVVVEEGAPSEVMGRPRTERFAAFLRRYEGMMTIAGPGSPVGV